MMHCFAFIAAFGLLSWLPTPAAAQFSIDWYTIDSGGGVSTGGGFELAGTIGQHDAGPANSGGSFQLTGGFWAVAAGADCSADFNGDGAVDSRDVIAFLNAWSARESSADCDANGLIDSRDVICFLNAWSAGC
jgi:hypothetical protein